MSDDQSSFAGRRSSGSEVEFYADVEIAARWCKLHRPKLPDKDRLKLGREDRAVSDLVMPQVQANENAASYLSAPSNRLETNCLVRPGQQRQKDRCSAPQAHVVLRILHSIKSLFLRPYRQYEKALPTLATLKLSKTRSTSIHQSCNLTLRLGFRIISCIACDRPCLSSPSQLSFVDSIPQHFSQRLQSEIAICILRKQYY